MSVRRWIGSAGIVVAVAAGTAATARAATDPEFEAQLSVLPPAPQPRGLPVQLLDALERLFESPEVKERVRLRLGDTPPVRVTAAANGTVLVRSRGATPERAAEATRTYAELYVDVRRRQLEPELLAASEAIRRKTDQIRSQLESAEEPRRTSLVELLGVFNTRLDKLQVDPYGPSVGGLTPAEAVAEGSRGAWFVAALGATVGVGAAVSARRSGRRDRSGR